MRRVGAGRLPGLAALRAVARGDAGSVTVEAALGIGSLVTVLAVGVAGVSATVTQIRLVDAAREAARVAAVEGPEQGAAAGHAAAPAGASVDLEVRGPMVHAQLAVSARALPGLELRARAAAWSEPGGAAATGVGVAPAAGEP